MADGPFSQIEQVRKAKTDIAVLASLNQIKAMIADLARKVNTTEATASAADFIVDMFDRADADTLGEYWSLSVLGAATPTAGSALLRNGSVVPNGSGTYLPACEGSGGGIACTTAYIEADTYYGRLVSVEPQTAPSYSRVAPVYAKHIAPLLFSDIIIATTTITNNISRITVNLDMHHYSSTLSLSTTVGAAISSANGSISGLYGNIFPTATVYSERTGGSPYSYTDTLGGLLLYSVSNSGMPQELFYRKLVSVFLLYSFTPRPSPLLLEGVGALTSSELLFSFDGNTKSCSDGSVTVSAPQRGVVSAYQAGIILQDADYTSAVDKIGSGQTGISGFDSGTYTKAGYFADIKTPIFAGITSVKIYSAAKGPPPSETGFGVYDDTYPGGIKWNDKYHIPVYETQTDPITHKDVQVLIGYVYDPSVV